MFDLDKVVDRANKIQDLTKPCDPKDPYRGNIKPVINEGVAEFDKANKNIYKPVPRYK